MGKSGYTVGEGTAAEDGSGGTDTTPRKDLKDISVDDVTFDDLATKDIPIGENGEINIDGESVLVTNNGNNFNLSSSDRVIFKEGDAEQFPTEGKLQEPTVYERDGDYYYSAFGVLRELSVDGTLGKTVKLEDIMGTTEEDDAEVVKEDGSGGTDTTRKDLKDISVDDVTFDDLVSKKIDGEADINIDGELMNVISDPNSFYVTSNESDGERIVFDESDAEPFPSNEGELVDFTVYAKGDKFYYKNAEGIKELSVDGDLLGEPLTFEDIMGTE
jgi:hypothetical protein